MENRQLISILTNDAFQVNPEDYVGALHDIYIQKNIRKSHTDFRKLFDAERFNLINYKQFKDGNGVFHRFKDDEYAFEFAKENIRNYSKLADEFYGIKGIMGDFCENSLKKITFRSLKEVENF